ncbi:MAG: saccharopine dehydrogenase NADP-binding domain-containing protein, partial [Ilumatobacteraceae bacterium]
MRVLIVGAGGVGSALTTICSRRSVFEHIVVADLDPGRAARAAATAHSDRVSSTLVDASSRLDVVELAATAKADVIVNACDPRFNPSIFEAAFEA